MDEGVGGGAVSKYTVHAEVVSQVAVGAWAWGTLVFLRNSRSGSSFFVTEGRRAICAKRAD